MADEAEASGKGTAPSRRRRIGGTKVPWLVMIGVAVLVAVIAILATQKPEGKGENKGARAVLVSTNDRPRTVLVPPCATGAPLASEPPAQIKETPGAISVLLPRGGGIRTVIVPECTAARGQNAMGAANLPSAAFVMPQGTQLPQIHPGSSSGGSTSGGEALKLE